MEKEIKYDSLLSFRGRNGTFLCSGLNILNTADYMYLQPITSKHAIGKSYIQFPKNKIQELIDHLETLK